MSNRQNVLSVLSVGFCRQSYRHRHNYPPKGGIINYVGKRRNFGLGGREKMEMELRRLAPTLQFRSTREISQISRADEKLCSNSVDERQLIMHNLSILADGAIVTMPKRIVSYLRVSTKGQGQSGLGLDAQRDKVKQYAERIGAEIVREFIEIESGKNNARPKLTEALAFCRKGKMTLVVAKLDRLTRNFAFLAHFLDCDVDLVALDNEAANKLVLRILASVAQEEREAISRRTKEALQAAKRRGALLGSARPGHWRGREAKRQAGIRKAQRIATQLHREKAINEYADSAPRIVELRSQGQTLRQIAETLTAEGFSTRRGGRWQPTTINLILKRLKA